MADGPHKRAMLVKKSWRLSANCKPFQSNFSHTVVQQLPRFREWSSRSLKVVENDAIWYAINHFPSVVFSNNVTILLCYRDIIIFTVSSTWLPATFRSPSVTIICLKLQALYTFQFILNILYLMSVQSHFIQSEQLDGSTVQFMRQTQQWTV